MPGKYFVRAWFMIRYNRLKGLDFEMGRAMSDFLVIVESPTKARAEELLGSSAGSWPPRATSSICPRSKLGIDLENDFEPRYITIRGKGKYCSS